MLALLPSAERGHANFGWLDSHHTFSFGDWYEPRRLGFRRLRVINDDTVSPGQGFGTHGHRDMEIVSYVLSGALEHKDSLGTTGVLKPGDVQRMSAGTGVRHSEYNASATEPVHFLQIWIIPDKPGIAPGYEQKFFAPAERQGRLTTVVSREPVDGALRIHADAAIRAGLLAPGDRVVHEISAGRHAYVHVARGAVTVNGEAASTGDGIAASQEKSLEIVAIADSELLVFDLA